MKRNNKKGFTIVELTIVIAVIAILAAVLIPTFSSVVDKANQSADIQLIRQANVVLQAATADGSSLTKAKADKELKNNSITLGTPSASDNEFIYLPSKNRFVIYNTQKKAVAYPEDLATEMSDWKPEFTIRYHDGLNLIYTTDANGNKIYGLVDCAETDGGEMKYSVTDGVITATAKKDDGWGVIAKTDLTANETYTVSCIADTSWGVRGDTVQIFVFTPNWSDYYESHTTHTNNNEYITIGPFSPKSGTTYSIRLDVNKEKETHIFKELRIVKGDEKVSGYMSNSSLAFGATENLTANAFAREGYTFKCWNTARDGSGIAVKDGASIKDLIEAGIDPGTVTLYAQWK